MKSWTCHCELDQDGACLPCKKKLEDFMKTLLDTMRRFMESQQAGIASFHGSCSGCGAKYIDGAIALLISAFDDIDRAIALTYMKYLVNTVLSLGVSAVPQSLEAWRSLCWKMGWDEDFQN